MEVHSCEMCHYKSKLLFGMIYHVRRHRLTSEGELFSCEKLPSLYSCPYCNFETDLSIFLKEHAIGLHKNEENEEVEDSTFSTYDCEKGKFQTFSVLVMLKHVTDDCVETTEETSTSQRKRFECDQCPFGTFYKVNLKRHKIYKHTSFEDIKWLQCNRCNLKFKTRSLLLKHVKMVHEIKRFKCAQCPYKTNYKFCFRRHTYTKHSDPSEIKWFKCDKCTYRNKLQSELERYVKRIHLGQAVKPRWFPCGQCSYVAKQKRDLDSHITRKHTGTEIIKWHKCDRCPYATHRKDHLDGHKSQNHTSPEDIKWLECDRCNSKFKTTSSRRYHVKKVHKMEWLECALCPYKTLKKYSLNSHVNLKHGNPNDIKWFKCDNCFYMGRSKGNLKKHVIRMHLKR